MHDATTQLVRKETRGPLSPFLRSERGRVAEALSRLKATLDDGESSWTPAIVLGVCYILAIPAFVVMLALAELAYRFG